MVRYHRIDTCDMNNGDGIRVVLWMSGCNHNCKNCHNPQTHDHNEGIVLDLGTIKDILDALSDESIDGLTISGGDAFFPLNRDVIKIICKSVKTHFPNKTIWCYTGYKFEELTEDLLENVDTIIDGRYVESLPTKKQWRGSDNQRRFDKINLEWRQID